MDYAGGNHLIHSQWEQIQNPALSFNIIPRKEDGADVIKNDENTPLALIKAIKITRENASETIDLGPIIIRSVDKKWKLKKPSEQEKTLKKLGDHRDYLQSDGVVLDNGSKISWIQVSADESVWNKNAPSPHKLGINVYFEDRDLATPGKTALMFKDESGKNVFWIIVKDSELSILKDYLLGSAFGLEILDTPSELGKDLQKDIVLVVKADDKMLDSDKNTMSYISDVPLMPKISIEIKTSNDTYKDDLGVRFKIHFQQTSAKTDYPETGIGDERKATTIFPINSMSKVNKIQNGIPWLVDYDGKFRGGEATVEIISLSKKVVIKEFKFKILGHNPLLKDIHQYVDNRGYSKDFWFIKRKIRHEAGVKDGKALQFNTTGTPRFGYPYGFGLGQIDNYDGGKRCTQQEIWNWKSNIDRGYLVLQEKRKTTLYVDFPNEIAKIKNIFELDPESVLAAEDQKEGDFNVIHAPSTKIEDSNSISAYFGGRKDDFPSVSVIDANVIKRYNGGKTIKLS